QRSGTEHQAAGRRHLTAAGRNRSPLIEGLAAHRIRRSQGIDRAAERKHGESGHQDESKACGHWGVVSCYFRRVVLFRFSLLLSVMCNFVSVAWSFRRAGPDLLVVINFRSPA